MIEARNLTRRFGTFTAVNDVSFKVAAGETLVLIGPSGCGKTTTLKMLNRLIAPSDGTVWIDEQQTDKLPVEELRRKMGYVIQNVGLFPHYTVAENIGIVPRLLKWDERKITQRTEELLHQTGLPPGQNASKYPHQLSGGQQQRVGIARALAAHPPILLMDEPFGALDPLTRQQLRQDFLELEALRATTIVMVTHDIEEAFDMGSQVALLDKGKIQQLAPPTELLSKPANDFVRAFISEQAERLELRALKVKDIFYQLSKEPITPGPALPINASVAVLHAIYSLGRASHQSIEVTIDKESRYATLDMLFQFFKNSFQ